ncbi:MAG: mandelate racemase/muconate lactonizing enzyme family protein [Deltaproteobacteria bacterium]|nr:mandelate racemase/muconate lactonizing enzyme family protein [Deltaproteobacteria bacterium]
MAEISRIEMYRVAVPLPETFYPSWIPGFPQAENRFDLVHVITSDGVEGWAAGARMANERQGLGSLLGPYLIGEDPTDIDLIQQRLREASYLGMRNFWLEPAFWDIKGKMEGKPVCELLGGEPCTVKLYASTGEVKEPEARIEEAEARYEEGFRTIKLRVHDFDEEKDIRHVVETAKAVGDRMKIGVDANQGWRVTVVEDAPVWDLARAKRFADACADAGVAWIEEPLPMDDYGALSELARYSKVPITGGELHTGGYPELKMMIERKCYDVFQPDATFSGGIAQTIKIAKLCKERGVGFSPHTWTNGFGFAVNLQIFAASGFAGDKELEYPLSPPSWVVEARDGVLEQPFTHEKATLEVPRKPGLGIEVDRRALRRYGKRVFVMDKRRLVWFALRDRGIKIAKEIGAAKKARKERESKENADG